MDSTELRKAVIGLSNEAFELAKQAVEGTGDKEQRAKQAQDINRRLEELLPEVQAAPATDQPTLNSAWSDGRLDVGYVMSGGQLSTSTRLYYFIEDLKRMK